MKYNIGPIIIMMIAKGDYNDDYNAHDIEIYNKNELLKRDDDHLNAKTKTIYLLTRFTWILTWYNQNSRFLKLHYVQ